MVLVPRVKITVPSLPSGFVARAELCAGLDAGTAAEVALVCAPAGYGKTLLLADWSRTSTGVDTAWVGVDRDDNDPRRLWAAVVAAMAGCPSVPQSSRLHGPWAWRAEAQPEFLGELAEALQALPQPLRLILDDVHELVDPVALHGVQILTRIKPASLQLVLSSRLDPPLSLPRLRLQGRLRELRAAQLAFTPAQAAQLLERSGLRLSPQQVEVLHRRTGGWVAGLRLAARAVEQSADREAFLTHFSGDDRSVADYLVGEILSGLPRSASPASGRPAAPPSSTTTYSPSPTACSRRTTRRRSSSTAYPSDPGKASPRPTWASRRRRSGRRKMATRLPGRSASRSRHNAFVVVDEGETFTRLGERNGANP